MMKKSHVLSIVAVAAIFAVSYAGPGLAASSSADWIEPLSDGATSLSDSLVSIGAPILGLCIAAFGVWSAMTSRVDFNKLWMFLLGGTLIGIGPKFGTWFMALFGA
jgi:hypothetical protein